MLVCWYCGIMLYLFQSESVSASETELTAILSKWGSGFVQQHSGSSTLGIRPGHVKRFLPFFMFLVFKGFFFKFHLPNAGHKITTHKQRFGHVNATNRNSYLNIICIKLVT